MRHITYKGGAIFDLSGVYFPDGRYRPLRFGDVATVQLEDIHASSATDDCWLEMQEWLAKYRPATILAGDLINWEAYSHHNKNKLTWRDMPRMDAELDGLRRFLSVVYKSSKLIVQDSNHHNHVAQWIERWDKPQDTQELKDFHAALGWVIEQQTNGTPVIQQMIEQVSDRRICYTSSDACHVSKSGRHWLHGHEGYRGQTLESLAKLTFPTVSGHGHSPGRKHLAIRVGATTKPSDAPYMGILHNWFAARAVEYYNGAAELIYVVP
jgi:hypothetical protein